MKRPPHSYNHIRDFLAPLLTMEPCPVKTATDALWLAERRFGEGCISYLPLRGVLLRLGWRARRDGQRGDALGTVHVSNSGSRTRSSVVVMKKDGRTWQRYARGLWEQNGRTIPPGMVVFSLVGNARLCTLDECVLLSLSELGAVGAYLQRAPTDDPALRRLMVGLVRLKNLLKKRAQDL